MRLKSFFKEQSAFKDLVEGEMMLGRTTKLRQKKCCSDRGANAGNSLGASLVTQLYHCRQFFKAVSGLGRAGYVLPAWLRQVEQNRGTYLCVFAQG